MPKGRTNKVSCQSFIYEMEVALEAIGGKWKVVILWNTYVHDIVRFNEFLKFIPGITQKMLTQQLRNLEDSNLLQREIFPTVPPTVEYRLTPLANELIPILEAINGWGRKFIDLYGKE